MFGKRAILLFLLCAGMCFGQWVQVDSGLPANNWVMSLAVSGSNIFIAGDGGVFLSTNNGTTWTAVNSGLGGAVNCLLVSGSNIFAGTSGAGVFLSTNNDTSWTAVNSGLPANSPWAGIWVRSLAVSGNNIFAGIWSVPGGVYLSTNNGTSWTAVNSGLTSHIILSLLVNGSNIFAGTGGYGVCLSTNNGTSWTAVNSGLIDTTVYSLAASGSNIYAGTDNGVYLSTNNGTSWSAVNSGLPANSWVMSLAVSGGNIFAGTGGVVPTPRGVFLSTNNGTSWTAVNSGLPSDTTVSCLAINGSNIFAGTHGAGVWRRPLSEMLAVINPIPQQGKLKQYASGFKINISKTGIALLLPETLNKGAITVGLFTIAGKRIYSAMHQAYNGTLNIPVSGLSTGAYLMSIRGNNTTLSSPFVVTK